MPSLSRSLIYLMLSLGTATLGAAQDRGNSRDHREHRSDDQSGVTVIAEAQIRLIRDYYTAKGIRPKPLPPGIAKNLARGKPIPPGIAKTRLPADLRSQLPPPRPGLEIVLLGDRVALLDKVGMVLDVRVGVFF